VGYRGVSCVCVCVCVCVCAKKFLVLVIKFELELGAKGGRGIDKTHFNMVLGIQRGLGH
jgi:hypothetical protein